MFQRQAVAVSIIADYQIKINDRVTQLQRLLHAQNSPPPFMPLAWGSSKSAYVLHHHLSQASGRPSQTTSHSQGSCSAARRQGTQQQQPQAARLHFMSCRSRAPSRLLRWESAPRASQQMSRHMLPRPPGAQGPMLPQQWPAASASVPPTA